MESGQEFFSPLKHGFRWTEDWYEFDDKPAHKASKKERDTRARDLRKQGYSVSCFTLRNQVRSKGGIGSGKPHIEIVCHAYGLDYYS